jgi:hypothetical protein
VTSDEGDKQAAGEEDADIERKRAAAAAAAWGGQPPAQPVDVDSAPSYDRNTGQQTPVKPQLADMSLEELEAELQRRKAQKL